MLRRTLSGLALAATMAGASSASAMTSVEGTVIGDQGFYWTTPSEVWIFPHRLGNIDNRVMFQWNGLSGTFYNLDGSISSSGAVSSIQSGPGGGLNIELIQDLNLGLWLSSYNPGHNAFVGRGVSAVGWNQYLDSIGDMAALNAATGFPASIEAGRKVDLFVSYWLSDLDIEAGLRFWYGSASSGLLPDESNGPIDIDVDSNPTTDFDPGDPAGGREELLEIDNSSYSVSDLGFGLGAGWRGMPGLRADLGFNINLLGVGWEPNGINNYVDIGGSVFSVNARGHFDLSSEWTVGGFARFSTASMGLEPQLQRDGGDLYALFEPSDPDARASLPDPGATPPSLRDPALDPAITGETVSQNAKYEESGSQLQVAGLLQYQPMSRAKIYTAFGFRRRAFTAKTSIGNIWSAETQTSWTTLPFIHLGAEGRIFSWLDLFLGASKQWRGEKDTTTFIDNRIPEDEFAQGPANTPTTAGQEDNTNNNRREIKTETTLDDNSTSTTSLMVGTRVHYGPFQLMAHINPNWLLTGTYAISGATAGNMFGWVAVIYDWDYDLDKEFGNGTQRYGGKVSPHRAEPAPARDDLGHERRAPKPKPKPEPEPEYEEFDS